MAMQLKPLSDRVILEPIDDETTTSAGGIIIPDTAKKKPQQANVVAVGPGRTTDEGGVIKPVVKKGDRVVFSNYAGTEYSQSGIDYLIVSEGDILAVVG